MFSDNSKCRLIIDYKENGDKTMIPKRYHVTIVASSIIVQVGEFYNNRWNFHTMSKSFNNDEGDFAVWKYSKANLRKAYGLLGDEDYSVVNGSNGDDVTEIHGYINNRQWYVVHNGACADSPSGTKIEALCDLARIVNEASMTTMADNEISVVEENGDSPCSVEQLSFPCGVGE